LTTTDATKAATATAKAKQKQKHWQWQKQQWQRHQRAIDTSDPLTWLGGNG